MVVGRGGGGGGDGNDADYATWHYILVLFVLLTNDSFVSDMPKNYCYAMMRQMAKNNFHRIVVMV